MSEVRQTAGDRLLAAFEAAGAEEAVPCCRCIHPEVPVCRHPGKAEGALGCIAFILGQLLRIQTEPVFPWKTPLDHPPKEETE